MKEEIIKKVVEIQRKHAIKLWEEVVERAPLRTGNYLASIQLGETIVEDGVISTEVSSDLNSGWNNVPLGALLEFGTGTEGMETNVYNHGKSYRLTPWVYFDEYLDRFVTTSGMIARPHFYPALMKIQPEYKKALERLSK